MKLVLRQIWAISKLTFQELVREKILWSAAFFTGFLLLLSIALGQLSYIDSAKIALTLGVSSISVIGGLLSTILGASLITKEIERRTLYLVLTKGLSRWQYVVGRYLGMVMTLVLIGLTMNLVSFLFFKAQGGFYRVTFLQNIWFQVCEFAILAGVACVFSTFSTSTLSAMISMSIWVIGHAIDDLKVFARRIESPVFKPLADFFTAVFPDLTRLDIKLQLTHGMDVTFLQTFTTSVYAFAYIAFTMSIAALVFSRRDL